VTPAPDNLPADVDALRAALAAEQLARREAEARASGAEAMVAHLKLVAAKLRHDRFGASSERGRKLLDQMELELEELEAPVSEEAAAAEGAADKHGSIASTAVGTGEGKWRIRPAPPFHSPLPSGGLRLSGS
jgi:hypothetical protein